MPNPKKNPTTLSVKMAQTIPTATATPASQKKHSRKLPHKQQKVQAKVQEKDQQIKVLPNLCYRTHGLIQGIIGMPRR